MERQIPKNVRQIGNVSDTPKIYVEDYVDTFFSQLCDKAGESPVGAFLVGDIQSTEEEEYVYIYGAIQMHELKLSGTEYVLDEDTWKHAYEDCKQYFEDGEMLGWFVAHAGVPLTAEDRVVKLHKKSFPKTNTVFIMKDPEEKEEAYFVHKLDDLMEIGGHFTYYEKNPCMQNYMISTRKKNGASPTETVEDQAAKDFRSIVRSREELMMGLWDTDEYVSDGTLTTVVSRLRSKLKACCGEELIGTKKRQGYFIQTPAGAAPAVSGTIEGTADQKGGIWHFPI